jgi:S-DNA-T family DNA segregation ATPase FtsK/SpoIIIE
MDQERKQKLTKEIQGILLGAAGIFLLLAILSYNTHDQSLNSYSSTASVRNLGGRIGADLSDLMLQLFGLAACGIPLGLLYLAYKLLRFKDLRWKLYKGVAFFTLLASLASLFAFNMEHTQLFGQSVQTGGTIGYTTAALLKTWLGIPGALLVILPLLAVSIMVLSRFSFVLFADWWIGSLGDRMRQRKERRELNRQLLEEGVDTDRPAPVIKAPAVSPPPIPEKRDKKERRKAEEEKILPLQETFEFARGNTVFQLPPLSLLDQPLPSRRSLDKEALAMNARLLEKKLKDFGIDGEVVEICPGPVITMYEFAPGPGVKVSRIASLSDDLTMALQAHSIRIVAPIPGKGVVGIELPNRERETVALREILSGEDFHKGKARLPMALGKDIAGHPVVTDLARAPHLLVAGATGSGKSVSINTIILSLLYTASPQDIRLIMVDPKMLELSVYEGIPHLLLPVVTDPKKASVALKWAVREMGRRYRLMADKGVRNIDSYNRLLAKDEAERLKLKEAEVILLEEVEEEATDEEAIRQFLDKEEALEHGHLPFIVVIVDELADLMMVAGREIEESIARLAQMARAAGIHLILATQRPSVDVITGLIKANFPARISFQVSSKTDSRTILDANGAESLLGMGDMLFMPPGTARVQRIHGAFVADAEVQRVVEFLKKQGKPIYDKSILEAKSDGDGASGDDDLTDERYDDAVALVADTRQASISMIQRRLRIGYNRAARIIERMEKEGLIAPSDGTSKPREVYINKI